MVYNAKKYHREYMKRLRRAKREKELAAQLEAEGKCTVCGMFLTSSFHVGCPHKMSK